MIGKPARTCACRPASLQTDTLGPLAMEEIRTALMHPGEDPRGRFHVPHLQPFLTSVEDLKEGMELEGVITNLVDFGAFVDIGVLQDGLVHLSELSNRYVKDPRRVVKPGQIVRVKIIKVDKETRAFRCPVKALLDKPQPHGAERTERPRRGGERPAPPEGHAEGTPAPEAGVSRPDASESRPPRRTETRKPAAAEIGRSTPPAQAAPRRRRARRVAKAASVRIALADPIAVPNAHRKTRRAPRTPMPVATSTRFWPISWPPCVESSTHSRPAQYALLRFCAHVYLHPNPRYANIPLRVQLACLVMGV